MINNITRRLKKTFSFEAQPAIQVKDSAGLIPWRRKNVHHLKQKHGCGQVSRLTCHSMAEPDTCKPEFESMFGILLSSLGFTDPG
mmetsp:Transcript_11914/g.49719  ORF Transcript_11914/g.49719 Transcript_11914/m.49719 type:complete len:85 (+) Transcript_11914:1699-1953(+)